VWVLNGKGGDSACHNFQCFAPGGSQGGGSVWMMIGLINFLLSFGDKTQVKSQVPIEGTEEKGKCGEDALLQVPEESGGR
jgi:GTPase involved in cell partitioning and DNA repair